MVGARGGREGGETGGEREAKGGKRTRGALTGRDRSIVVR